VAFSVLKEVHMDHGEREEIQEAVSAFARLVMWLADEIEPTSAVAATRDMDLVEAVLVQASRKYDEWVQSRVATQD